MSSYLTLRHGSTAQLIEQAPTQQTGEQLDQQSGQEHQASIESNLPIMVTAPDDDAMTHLVDDALRHLHNRSYLGQHPLAELQIVKLMQCPPSDGSSLNTHLSLGHALRSLLVDVIERLRPTGL